MDFKQLDTVLRRLPQRMTYPYYPHREDAWLMAQQLRADTPVAAWRKGRFGKLLDRPLIRPVVAGSGGMLRPHDFHALAYAGQGSWDRLSHGALRAMETVYAAPWQDFEVTFAWWGARSGWGHGWQQTSRAGGNLVIQLGFPSDHAALMGRYLPRDVRKRYELGVHPVRETGRPTLAWARLDLEPATNTVLIEEIQSDWLRFVRDEVEYADSQTMRSRSGRAEATYERALRKLYGKLWPRVMMLCALEVVREFFGECRVFLHQPGPGAVLKRIGGTKPPVSLYTALPRAFCFAPTQAAPGFLDRPRRRELARLRRSGAPLFWELSFQPGDPWGRTDSARARRS